MTRLCLVSALTATLFLGACTHTVEGEEITEEQAQQALAKVEEGATVAVTLVTPLLDEGSGLSEGDGASEEDIRNTVESGIVEQGGGDANEASTEPSCSELTWLGGLSARITFDGCPTSSGGTVDGDMTLGIGLFPTRFAIGFDDLRVDGSTLDGSGTITFQKGLTTLDADFAYVNGGEATRIVLDGVSIQVGASGTTLAGSGYLKVGPLDGDFALGNPTWRSGDCIASSGSITYSDVSGVSITGRFLPTTPDDGVVEVQIGSLAPYPYQLIQPCGS